jgi:hypothetical protein
MTPDSPPPPQPPPTLSVPPPAKNKNRFLLYGCGGFLALLLIIVGAVALTIWWVQRPIRPIVLSAREKATADAKIQRIQGGTAGNTNPGGRSGAFQPGGGLEPEVPQRFYVPGSKVLKLTEREINGLLNANTELGKSVRLEFDQDAINAYVAVRIPDDFPIGGGKMFRARGRFRVSLGNGGKPYAILEDVTVFGLSLPKAWLGGIKGENLIGEAMMGNNQSPGLKGVKSLRVEPGSLVLELED